MKGKGHDGNTVKRLYNFLHRCSGDPEANPLEPQLIKFAKKIQAGAKYFQTQAIYDITMFNIFYVPCEKNGHKGTGRHRGSEERADGAVPE